LVRGSNIKQFGGEDSSPEKTSIHKQPNPDPFDPVQDTSKKGFAITEVKQIAEDEDSVKAGVNAEKNKRDDDWDDFSDRIEGNSNRESEQFGSLSGGNQENLQSAIKDLNKNSFK